MEGGKGVIPFHVESKQWFRERHHEVKRGMRSWLAVQRNIPKSLATKIVLPLTPLDSNYFASFLTLTLGLYKKKSPFHPAKQDRLKRKEKGKKFQKNPLDNPGIEPGTPPMLREDHIH